MRWMWVLMLIAILPGCGGSERDSYLQAALIGSVTDSSSLQFQDVAENKAVICGEFNRKTSADRTYEVFVFDRANNIVRTEDEQKPEEYAAFYRDLRSRCSNASKLLDDLRRRVQVPVS